MLKSQPMRRSALLTALIAALAIAIPAAGFPQWQKLFEKGRIAFEKNDMASAEEYFQKAYEAAPNDGDIARWLGEANYRNGKYAQAIEVQKQAIAKPHSREQEIGSWICIAMSQEKLDQRDAAMATWKRCVELAPSNPWVFIYLGTSHLDAKRYNDVETAAKRVLALDPSSALAYDLLCGAYIGEDKPEQALEAAQQGLRLSPKSVRYRFVGTCRALLGDYAGAMDAYREACRLDEKDWDCHIEAVWTGLMAGRSSEAVDIATKVIEAEAYVGVGLTNRIESAVPVVTAMNADGPAARAGIKIGDRIVKVDRKATKGWDSARLTKALRDEAGKPVVLLIERTGASGPLEITIVREQLQRTRDAAFFGLRSLAWRSKGQGPAALQDAEKASALDSKHPWARCALAAVRLDEGKSGEAAAMLSGLEAASKGRMALDEALLARYIEAGALFRQGKTGEAAKILAAAPEDELPTGNVFLIQERRAALALFKPLAAERRAKARLLELKGQFREALEESAEAWRLSEPAEAAETLDIMLKIAARYPEAAELPEAARNYAMRASMAIQDRDYRQAAREYRAAIRVAPYAAKLYYNAALVQVEGKNYGEAIRLMRLFVKGSPDGPDVQAAKDEIVKWEYTVEKGKT